MEIASSCTLEDKALSTLRGQLTEDWSVVFRERDMTTANSLFTFRVLSRLGATINELLRDRHRRSPYEEFQLLNETANFAVANRLILKPLCLIDTWARKFRHRYPTAAAMNSTDARQELLLLADIIECETSRIECKHAAVRRCKEISSIQTWAQNLLDMSAESVCHNIRKDEPTTPGPGTDSVEAEAGNKAASRGRSREKKVTGKLKQPRRRRRGGGGAWRVYVAAQTKGSTGVIDFASIAKDYHRLSPQEREHWDQLGKLATQLHPLSGLPGTRPGRKRRKRQPPATPVGEAAPGAAILPFDAFAEFEDRRLQFSRSARAESAAERQAAANDHAELSSMADPLSASPAQQQLMAHTGIGAGLTSAQVKREFSRVPTEVNVSHLETRSCDPERTARVLALLHDKKLAAELEGNPLSQDFDQWYRDLHKVVRYSEIPKLGHVPKTATKCNLFGVCVCRGHGRAAEEVIKRLHGRLKSSCQQKDFAKLLSEGFVVLKLSVRPPFPAGRVDEIMEGGDAAGSPGVEVELPLPVVKWLHVAMLYLSPWRISPTQLEWVSHDEFLHETWLQVCAPGRQRGFFSKLLPLPLPIRG